MGLVDSGVEVTQEVCGMDAIAPVFTSKEESQASQRIVYDLALLN